MQQKLVETRFYLNNKQTLALRQASEESACWVLPQFRSMTKSHAVHSVLASFSSQLFEGSQT